MASLSETWGMKSIGTGLLFCALLSSGVAQGQAVSSEAAYPTRAIRIVVPFSPGTGIDILARSLEKDLRTSLKQPIFVDNKAGASGLIGTKDVMHARPDGHTLLMAAIGHVLVPYVYPKSAQYDPFGDFTPIALVASGRLMLVAPKDGGITSLDDFIKKAKASPGKLTYSSPGAAAPHNLAMELLGRNAGFEVLHVPYSGTAGALTSILAGEVSVAFLPVHVAMSHVRAGKLVPLALASGKRSAMAPDVPTLAELGYPGAEADMWYGLLGPKGLPDGIVQRLQQLVAKALADPEVLALLEKQGLEPSASTPEEFEAMMRRESEKWSKIIQLAGIRSE